MHLPLTKSMMRLLRGKVTPVRWRRMATCHPPRAGVATRPTPSCHRVGDTSPLAGGEEGASGMFTRLGDTSKAAIFTVLVLLLALAAALLVRALGLTSGSFRAALLYMSTPTLAMLLMLLAVTRDGYSMEGWKVLGLHRLGLKAW